MEKYANFLGFYQPFSQPLLPTHSGICVRLQEIATQYEGIETLKKFIYTGIIKRLDKNKNYPKEIELRKTKHLWISKDGRTYSQKDGTTVNNPYTPVILDLSSIKSKEWQQ